MTHKDQFTLYSQTVVNQLYRAVFLGPLLNLNNLPAISEHELTADTGRVKLSYDILHKVERIDLTLMRCKRRDSYPRAVFLSNETDLGEITLAIAEYGVEVDIKVESQSVQNSLITVK